MPTVRKITREEANAFRNEGRLKCPGDGVDEPCGNHMVSYTKNSKGKPLVRPELHCPACNVSLRLFDV